MVQLRSRPSTNGCRAATLPCAIRETEESSMNLFQLVTKQMRQRALSTWLTLLSVLLGVSLAVAIMILRREGQNLFAQKDFGYDIIVGPPKGSPLQLTLNTIYHIDVSPGVIPYSIYEDMARKSPALPGHPDYR